MTDQAQNKAIAEWYGWKKVRLCMNAKSGLVGYAPDDPFPHDKGEQAVPDYTRDLNAISGAEQGLGEAMRSNYLDVLAHVVSHRFESDEDRVWKIQTAIAAQRAEAMIRTLGLW